MQKVVYLLPWELPAEWGEGVTTFSQDFASADTLLSLLETGTVDCAARSTAGAVGACPSGSWGIAAFAPGSFTGPPMRVASRRARRGTELRLPCADYARACFMI